MARKKLYSLLLLIACVAVLFVTAIPAYAEEISYYVCLSSQNYNVRNQNKMKLDTDHYVLENITLSSSIDFYIISSEEEKFYASDGSNMSVSDSDSHKYNILFSRDYIYDAAHATGDIEETNSNISYSIYIPGHFAMTIDGVDQPDFKYNYHVSQYDAYILPEAYIAAGNVVSVTDQDSGTTYDKTVENAGYYRIIFTPTVNKNANDYAFNSEGEYGTGEEYKENLYIADSEFYYISYQNTMVNEGTPDTFTYEDTEIQGYRLARNEDYPLQEVFNSTQFFVNKKDTRIKYVIYYYSHIFDKYEIIDDDNDKDTQVSEKKVSDISWYSLSLTVGSGSYASAIQQETRDFEGYYLIGEFNNYGYNQDGTLNLDAMYKLSKVEEGTPYYEEDKEQYVLAAFVVSSAMFDEDEDAYLFLISNGKTVVKDTNSEIRISTPGKYDILYCKDSTYNGKSFKYIRTEDSDSVYTHYSIASAKEFIQRAYQWNLDSESSKYIIYTITEDLDFTGLDIPVITVFHGSILGGGHAFRNITLVRDNGEEGVGVFGLITKYGSLSDIQFENVEITAKDSSYVGVIARNYGTITNTTVTGRVEGNQYVGGLVGYNGNYDMDSDTTTDSSIRYGYAILRNVENQAEVFGKIIVGGVCGFNGGKIIDSLNEADINHKNYSSSEKIYNIGGITGYSTGEILNSVNHGLVGYDKTGKNVGGIAGLGNGAVYYCNNSACIYGKDYVGGIVGYFGSSSNETTNSSTLTDQISNVIGGSYTGSGEDPAYTEEKDISSHIIVYSLNTGGIMAVSYAGGIVGYNNAQNLSIENSIANGDVFANSGSYAGGIAGYLNGGSIESCFSNGRIEANGTINRYVGGICGYSSGRIEGCFTAAVLTGKEYVGGIAGYVTSQGKILSTYANALLLVKSDSLCIGNIAGYIDGMDQSSSTYGSRVQYNYFLGIDEKDYGGINGVTYGKNSKYAAYRLIYTEIVDTGLLSHVNHNFGKIEDEDSDVDTFYFEEATGYSLPWLKHFLSVDLVEDDEFDDDTDVYQEYSYYYDLVKEEYETLMKEASQAFYRVVFKEWNSNEDENTSDKYDVISIVTMKYGEDISSIMIPSFVNAYAVGTQYRDDRKDSSYYVTWEAAKNEFHNQILYAQYEEISSSYYNEEYGMFVEGSFTGKNNIYVEKDNGFYTVTVTKNGQSLDNKLIIKVKLDRPDAYNVYDSQGKQIESKVYGSYIEFSVSSGESFQIQNAPFTWRLYPVWAKIVVIVLPILGLFIVLGVVFRQKKGLPSLIENTPKEDAEPLDKDVPLEASEKEDSAAIEEKE